MTLELVALLVVVGFLAWDRWQTTRLLVRAHDREPDLVKVISELCQRIQAPSIAVAEHTATILDAETPQHVPMDDDQAFNEAVYGISKEDLAMMAADQERNGAR